MTDDSPPNPATLVAKAKKCKGYKTVDAICNQIEGNAAWCRYQNMDEAVMIVLLDATEAMKIVHQRYEGGSMAEMARINYNGKEDNWVYVGNTEQCLDVRLKNHSALVTADVRRTLSSLDFGDFEGMDDLINSKEFRDLVGSKKSKFQDLLTSV